jgi:hypothetical protein
MATAWGKIRKKLRIPSSWREAKKFGWKFILAFVLFYLVRDTILYIIIPYLVYRGVISF